MEKNAEANKGGGLSPEESAAPIWSRENSLAALANIVCAAQEAMVQTAESNRQKKYSIPRRHRWQQELFPRSIVCSV